MTTATTLTVLCPLGCGRQISAEQDEVHYCVRRVMDGRKVVAVEREYIGTWDGGYICAGDCYHEAEVKLREYKEGFRSSGLMNTVTELDGGDPEAVTPVEPGEPAIRFVQVGWDGKEHPDLASIAAQVLLPLAHLDPILSKEGTYLLARAKADIPVPADDHAIVCNLIDALHEVAVQLPVRPDAIYATLHIGDEMYTVQHNGLPRPTPRPLAPTASPAPVAPSATARLISCMDLDRLAARGPSALGARLAALSSAELEMQATVYAEWRSFGAKKPISRETVLAEFRRAIAAAPRCPSCGDPTAEPGLCCACTEAREHIVSEEPQLAGVQAA